VSIGKLKGEGEAGQGEDVRGGDRDETTTNDVGVGENMR